MAENKDIQIAQQVDATINNSFIEGLTKQLVAKEEFGLSFPKDYNVSNSLMGAYLALKETVDKNGKSLLETCSPISVANSLMDMATLGLSVQKKQGYFIAYGNRCQFQRSYFGNITIARRYGLKSVNAEVIYDGDDFEYHIEDGIKVLDKHIQKLENIDNNKIVGAYAVVTMSDGSKTLEVMNIAQIKQSWQQGYGYKENGGTHSKFADQMAKKTVINRALKGIINTHGDVFVQEADERTEDVDYMETVEADLKADIEKNANSEEFVIDDVVAEDVIEVNESVTEPSENAQPKDIQSKNKKSQNELPDFMKEQSED